MVDRNQLIEGLKAAQGTLSQKRFAEELGCSPSYLSDIYSGKRDPGNNILEKLGYRKVVMYEETK